MEGARSDERFDRVWDGFRRNVLRKDAPQLPGKTSKVVRASEGNEIISISRTGRLARDSRCDRRKRRTSTTAGIAPEL